MINTFGGNLFGGRIRNLHKSISKCKKRGGKKKTFEEKVSAKPFLKFHVRFSTSFYLWPINGTTNIPYI